MLYQYQRNAITVNHLLRMDDGARHEPATQTRATTTGAH